MLRLGVRIFLRIFPLIFLTCILIFVSISLLAFSPLLLRLHLLRFLCLRLLFLLLFSLLFLALLLLPLLSLLPRLSLVPLSLFRSSGVFGLIFFCSSSSGSASLSPSGFSPFAFLLSLSFAALCYSSCGCFAGCSGVCGGWGVCAFG